VFANACELVDCRHRICRECLSVYLQVKIQEKLVTESELSCPMPGCGQAMTVPQVEGAIRGTPLWDRFLKTRAELWRPELPATSASWSHRRWPR